MPHDPYAPAAEYLDIFSLAMWQTLRPVLAEVLGTVDTAAGPILDLGAGTGLGTEVVLDTLPGARVLAVEPSPGLRGVLLARLAGDPDRAARVTVQPADAAGARLPDRLGGVIAMNMIGHLGPAERAALWHRLAERLAPGAPLVVGLQEPHEAVTVPRMQFADVAIGDLRYEGFGSAEPTGPESLRWSMQYRTVDGGTVLSDTLATYDWWILPPAAAHDELEQTGFTVDTADAGLLIAHRFA